MSDDPRDDATPGIVTDRPLLFDDEAPASADPPAPRRSAGPSAPRAARRSERARRRRRNWAVVGVLAVLILPFVLAGRMVRRGSSTRPAARARPSRW